MINWKTNKTVQGLDSLIVPAFERRKCKTIQYKKNITPHHNRLYNSDLSCSGTCQSQINLPYSHFKSRLISYLSQTQAYLQMTIELDQLARNTSQQLDVKRQNSNSCKQTKIVFGKKNLKKKNIKQYISEAALARRRKNKVEAYVHPEQEVSSSKFKKTKQRSASLIITNNQSLAVNKLIPIHHNQTYLYEKDQIRRLNNFRLKSKAQQFLSGQEESKQKQNLAEQGQKQLTQSRIQIVLQAQVDDSFKGKFQENIKLNKKGSNSCPKRANFIGRRRKNINGNSQQELEQISPWKRRNTIDFQPLIVKNTDIHIP